MATIKSTLALNDKMSGTLSSITKAMRSTLNAMNSMNNSTNNTSKAIQKAKNDIKNAENQLNAFTKSTNKSAEASNSLYSSLIKFSALKQIFNFIIGHLDDAINRLDIINNYPKVMSNLGIDETASQASINKLSEKLQGLPTTLDDAALAVQRFTSANNNISASTDMFLAVNNAILAGGASMSIQSSALEQLSQAYAKGKPDMMEWRTLMTAMPAQLNQIAKAMGYVSASALGEALREGEESMNNFMKTIMKMNTEGVDGFKSFEEQARNATNGLKTALTNMNTAITKGLTEMLTNINKTLNELGLPSIQTMIENVGKTFKKVITKISNRISTLMRILSALGKVMSPVLNIMKDIYNVIKNNWSWLAPIIYGVIAALILYNTWTAVVTFSSKLLAGALKLIGNTALISTLLIGAIIGILIYLWETNDTVAYWIIWAWDMLRIGVQTLKVGVLAVFYAIVLAAQYMGMGILGVVYAVLWAWNMFLTGIQSVAVGIEYIFQGLYNAILAIVNGIISALNAIPGVSIDTVEYASFADDALNQLADDVISRNEDLQSIVDDMNSLNDSINENKSKYLSSLQDESGDVISMALEFESTRDKRTEERTKLTEGIGNAVEKATNSVTDSISGTLDDLVTTDSSGDKALKTTSDDKLISDEDIQLLLDVATRDYKLNYQHVTPNITLTFGDIHETADVDGILDEVATRLEEIYDGNLEVN